MSSTSMLLRLDPFMDDVAESIGDARDTFSRMRLQVLSVSKMVRTPAASSRVRAASAASAAVTCASSRAAPSPAISGASRY
eukprot:CAMPEP_0118942510 /NCGR_PEP_ID=MMETSP1169-20130426/36318_1 /TAXON_ID=36882 /ORGANISM="Pyramimonas obovata, Strain CCMP722" /LENGTH=80 /DNA_ID=CAMNT_0006887535 /DNA_START=132 /DNA_END=371 /DNA_ORIENTATION=-